MGPRKCEGYYVTGTDTGVGKTFASVALIHAFRARGKAAVGMKPVAAGCAETSAGLRNDDALALQSASEPTPAYELVNPFALPAPTAPQIAASLAGIVVSLPPMIAAYQALSAQANVVVIEGVGGWLAPFADGLEQSQLAAALDLPVILVVGLKLGCLSHARLSERAIRADGLRLAGWIGNAVEPDFAFSIQYRALLQRELGAPCLGCLPHAAGRSAARFAADLCLPGEG